MAKRKLPKKPKKPRASAPVATWERFDERMKEWHRKVAAVKHGHKKKESLMKKYSHC